jgi:hypothetical protein
MYCYSVTSGYPLDEEAQLGSSVHHLHDNIPRNCVTLQTKITAARRRTSLLHLATDNTTQRLDFLFMQPSYKKTNSMKDSFI